MRLEQPGDELGEGRVDEVSGLVDVPAEAGVARHADAEPQAAPLGRMAPERACAVSEPEPGGGGNARHVRAVFVAVRHQGDPGELGHPGQIVGQRQIAVGDDHPGEAVTSECGDPVGDCAVETATGPPDDLCARRHGPGADLVVVTDHGHRQRRGGGDHPAGQLSGQRRPLRPGHDPGEAHLCFGEGLHRDEDGNRDGHERRALAMAHEVYDGAGRVLRRTSRLPMRAVSRSCRRSLDGLVSLGLPAGVRGAGATQVHDVALEPATYRSSGGAIGRTVVRAVRAFGRLGGRTGGRHIGSPAMEIRVAVIGAGSWGTTVATLAAQNVPTMLWARRPELAEQINTEHRNGDYLADFVLPSELKATADLELAVRQADVLVMGVPSHGFRAALQEVRSYLRPWVPVVSLAKGLELGTRLRMSEVVEQELPGHPVAVLTGPNLAKEILAGHAAASVIATDDDNVASALQAIFATDVFRVYTNEDVIGCELGGVLKNVIAIAAGMGDGLNTGDNTRAAVITRGLNELTRLGVAMGGNPLTFSGLAGMGDLVATCISTQSRNRHVGEQLGAGRTIEEIIESMHMVAEGVKTSKVVMDMAEHYSVDMAIASEVKACCHDGRTAQDAYAGLLRRETGREMQGISERR